jgi:NAD(P)-dependent dehydrogenase (short-subunit alcohol dehydrogenase family)
MAPGTKKVAVITGGGKVNMPKKNKKTRLTLATPASGIGLATATKIASRGDWSVHILDANVTAGDSAVSTIGPSATFHKTDVTSYESQRAVFKKIFETEERIDFVFANAGIGERANFYKNHEEGSEGPSEPMEMGLIISVCLNGAIMTSYLAQHYFRLSPPELRGDQNLVITASCGALYPSNYAPVYTATKHGVLGFMRSIAPQFWRGDHVRVNAVLPGTVRTNLLSKQEWSTFPQEYFTPVEKIVEVVLMFVDGKDPVKGGDQGVLKGKAVECCGVNHYYRDQPEYCDEAMRAVMQSTDIVELKS